MECWMRSQTTYRALRAAWSSTWRYARPTLGWLCIGVGVLGLALPLLPGVPIVVLGIALVGRRTWIIRWAGIHGKVLLRRWAALPTPIIGRIGRWALRVQQRISSQRRLLSGRLKRERTRQRALPDS
jgi:hypothetical protein